MKTIQVPQSDLILSPLPWQDRGLSFTASGYGKRIPTRYMLKLNGRLRRIYAYCVSNTATLFIGKSLQEGYIVETV